MKGIPINAELRTTTGSAEARRLRRRGFVPAVMYGVGQQNVLLALPKGDFSKIVSSRTGEHSMVELHFDDNGTKKVVSSVIEDVQHDPLTDLIVHADFKHVRDDVAVVFTLPVKYTGTAVGIKNGGTVSSQVHEIEVVCTPQDAPEEIVIDITDLDAGSAMRIRDVDVPNVKLVNSPEFVLITIAKAKGAAGAAHK